MIIEFKSTGIRFKEIWHSDTVVEFRSVGIDFEEIHHESQEDDKDEEE